jgi:hypothetical protein
MQNKRVILPFTFEACIKFKIIFKLEKELKI